MPSHLLTRYNAVPPTRSRADPQTKVRHTEPPRSIQNYTLHTNIHTTFLLFFSSSSLLQVCPCRLSALRATVSTSLKNTAGKAQAAQLKFLQARLLQPTERKPRPRPPLVNAPFMLTIVTLAKIT